MVGHRPAGIGRRPSSRPGACLVARPRCPPKSLRQRWPAREVRSWAGSEVGEIWRLVVQIDDPTGVSWPVVIWSDEAGNRIPAPAQPVQP